MESIMEGQDIILPNSAVIEFLTQQHEISSRYKVVTVINLYNWLREKFTHPESPEVDWFGEGVDCMILDSVKNSTNWVRGDISIKFIFSCHQSDSQEQLIGSSASGRISIDEECVIRIPLEAMEAQHQLAAATTLLGMGRNMFTQKELVTRLRQRLSLTDMNSYRYAWLDYGVPCRVSFPGLSNGWSKGTVYLEVGYQPDDIEDSEPLSESSLDEIRNSIEAN
jgi:hypothetical protein